MNPEQITERHRGQLAFVYVRQSSAHQVIYHQESQRRQRHFVERASQLGWPQERIQVVDDDLRQSSSRCGQRFGFEEMVEPDDAGQITDGAPWRIRLKTDDTTRLKSGELEGVRVQAGRRTVWRIRLP